MYVPGYLGKLLINNTRFAFTRAQWSTKIDNLRVTNSEGIYDGGAAATLLATARNVATVGSHTSINGNGVCELTITGATWDTVNNIFAAPFLIGAGFYCAIVVAPAGGAPGVAVAAAPFLVIPSFHVLEVTGDDDALGLTPIQIRGESNGPWSNPYV